jgi:hypothetical protein
MRTPRRTGHRLGWAAAAALLLAGAARAEAAAPIQPLSVAVIKSTTGMCRSGQICHKGQAGVWVPKTDVAIVAVSVPEQTDVDLYVDIEISTAPEMYLTTGHIFRAKYAGPGLFDYGASSGNTFLGSNVTTTNISFPSGTGIVVKAGTPVYVHLDARNGSLIDVVVDQDCYLYYLPAK